MATHQQSYNEAIDDCLKEIEEYCHQFGYPRAYDELRRRLTWMKFEVPLPPGGDDLGGAT